MPALKNKRQELFCLYLLEGKTQAQAGILAGYAPKNIRPHTSALVTKGNIQARLAELQQLVEDAKIMSVKERKERLSEIARANLTDYMELGQDGSWVNIGKETPHPGAIQEIHSRTEYDKDGAKPTVYTSVKLHSPIQAISELNKMEHIGEPVQKPLEVHIDALDEIIRRISSAATRSGETSDPPQLEAPTG